MTPRIKITELHVQELLRIKHRSRGGMLDVKRVVAAARSKSSVLHQCFEWDDGRAAGLYRLEQARSLIQIAVSIRFESGEPMRVFVSLSPDRNRGGGYHETQEVLKSAELRAIMLRDAVQDILSLRARYGVLPELNSVWKAAAAIMAAIEKG